MTIETFLEKYGDPVGDPEGDILTLRDGEYGPEGHRVRAVRIRGGLVYPAGLLWEQAGQTMLLPCDMCLGWED